MSLPTILPSIEEPNIFTPYEDDEEDDD